MGQIEATIEFTHNCLEHLVVNAPFDQGLAAIKRAGGKLSTTQQVAGARVAAGMQHRRQRLAASSRPQRRTRQQVESDERSVLPAGVDYAAGLRGLVDKGRAK